MRVGYEPRGGVRVLVDECVQLLGCERGSSSITVRPTDLNSVFGKHTVLIDTSIYLPVYHNEKVDSS